MLRFFFGVLFLPTDFRPADYYLVFLRAPWLGGLYELFAMTSAFFLKGLGALLVFLLGFFEAKRPDAGWKGNGSIVTLVQLYKAGQLTWFPEAHCDTDDVRPFPTL
jgi:hypothetical protein